ncbi:MAG: Na+/H+ antiporter NhaC [Candidatus Marinimicrobia bacterium]|nr:Na+/H+ antiporter NhaC [Candidatus Neomarinimicrobiota bacterium]
MKKKTELVIPFRWAIVPVIYLALVLVYVLRFLHGDPHIPLISAAAVAAIVAVFSGYRWEKIRTGMINTIKISLPAILVLMIIGMIIGTWITAGIVPTMIYYGLKIISPRVFLLATALICCIVSLATGSSWTTAGTVGVALIGIGKGFGIPLPMVAGAIISGAYFGDKMSPLSDTTNLAPAVTGAKLFEHIRHMVYTTGPSLVIALILYTFLGLRYGGKDLDMNAINVILNGLSDQFFISPVLLLPPLLVIGMVIFKVPAIPGLLGGTVLGGLFAALFQHTSLNDIVQSAHYGFVAATGNEAIDNLLTRGGLDSMMWTVSLILCAMSFAGVLESSGMLKAIALKIISVAKSTGSLVTATVLTCIGTNMIAGDQYLAIVLPGRMFKKIYDDRGLKPKNLSRILEDAGTLTSSLIPWNSGGAFMFATLGVYPFAYLPFAFLNLINPLVSIFYGYTGFTIEKYTEAELKVLREIEKTDYSDIEEDY